MKQYIKTSAVSLLMGLALVSCNDNFEEGPGAIIYPEHFELGIWANDNAAADDVKYTVNLTVTEQGDTVCDVTTYDPKTGNANVLSNGVITYDRRTGMLIADYAESPFESPARVSLTYKNNLQGLTVNVFSSLLGEYKNEAYFTPSKATSVSVYGDWQLTDGTVLSLNTDNQNAKVVDADGNEETATYTYEITSGTVTTASGKAYTMSLNEKGQMYVALNGGEPVYTTHIMTPLPDDWMVFATGSYTSWMFKEAYSDLPLEYSEYRQKARISGIYPSNATMTFLWKKGNATVTLLETAFPTGYGATDDAGNQHQIIAESRAISDSDKRKAYYSSAGKGMFYFAMNYGVPALGFYWEDAAGTYLDTFIISDLAE